MKRLIPKDFKRNHFNTMRLVLALMVIWSHCFALYYGSEDNEPVSLLLGGAFNAGNIGVRMFFIISGFLIAASYIQSASVWSYLGKRIRRIYPGFIVAVLFCAFIVTPLFSNHAEYTAKTFLGLPILQSYLPASDVFSRNPNQAVNGALWSVQFEFWCYLGVIAMGQLGLLKRPVLVIACALVFTFARIACDILGITPGFATDFLTGWPYMWTSVAPCFLAGTLAWLYREELPRSRILMSVCTVLLIVSAHTSQLLFGALFPYLTAYLTFYMAFVPRSVPDAARWGDFSYGTYLYGFPIQQMFISAGMPFFLYVPVTMAVSVIAGATSWFLVERHFIGRRPGVEQPQLQPELSTR